MLNSDSTKLKRHFVFALLIGLFLRLLSIHFVWGPQGLDDYLDNLIPAWKHLVGLDPDLHNYRSPFFMWILSSWLRLGSWFGVEKAISQVQWVYFFQALVTLLGLSGVNVLVLRQMEKKGWDFRSAVIPLYLVAAHGIMPFASTRAFMETTAMGLAPLAMAWLILSYDQYQSDQKSWDRHIWLGAALMGVSTLIRFQMGIMYVAWFGFLVYRRQWKSVLVGFLMGLVLIVAEASIDLSYGRTAFQTLHDYFAFNSDQLKSGIMPWYNTWVTWLGALFVPFSLVFGRSWWRSFKENIDLLFPALIYIVVHSINPHKEERYLYPILMPSFLLLGRAWAMSWNKPLEKFFFRPFIVIFNGIILFVACFVNTQVSLIGPYGEIQMHSDRMMYMDFDHVDMRDNMAEFFVRGDSVLRHPVGDFNADTIKKEFESSQARLDGFAVMKIRSAEDFSFTQVYQQLAQDFQCSDLMEATSLSDRILYRLRPEKNQRRRPTSFFYCHRRS
jgi:hypothetical protein